MAHREIFISGVHFQNWMPVGAGNSLEALFFISPILAARHKHRHYHHHFSNAFLRDAAAIQIKLNELIRVSKPIIPSLAWNV
jgi:low affinity Fe/Cu permease